MGVVQDAPKTTPKRPPAIPPAAVFLRLPKTRGGLDEIPPRGRPWISRPYALPRRGRPVAIGDRVPRRYRRDERETRQPRGSDPRGTQRGGPERSANDPRRNPRGGQCGGPARSAKETQTPNQSSHAKADGETGKAGQKTRPIIVTTEKGGRERRWGPLSRANAWRAGCFVERRKGDVQVFLEKDGVKKEVQAVKRLQGGRDVFG